MPVTPDSLIDDIESLTTLGRSLQKEIGVSEIGMTCRRCVARKMAEFDKAVIVSSWRTTIGRAVHELLANELPELPHHKHDGSLLVENGLIVHTYKGWTLRGSCDVFAPNLDSDEGLVLDWKVVGDDTLETTRRAILLGGAPKAQYVIQGQLYGLGWALKGYSVKRICIAMLPANKGNLRRDHVKYEYDFDPMVAATALAAVEQMIDDAEVIGWEAVVKSYEPERGCLSCPSYHAVDNPQRDLLIIKNK
jgi:hypothetical protein